MAPFQYVVLDGSLYFHFTDYGKKMRLIENDKRVCVEIEEYREDLSEYSFIVLRGALNVVSDPQERARAIRKIADEGEQKLSPNFLPAHGLNANEGWSTFSADKPLVIVKLTKIIETIGLKSPE
jgi:nitroimidazol reductase NimA-like FMN-containing flavoprotein (pyridoxamine 5'-phosphate oxidase superfamily)